MAATKVRPLVAAMGFCECGIYEFIVGMSD